MLFAMNYLNNGFTQIVARVFGPVLTVTLFAALVCYAWARGRDVKLTSSVVPLLSIVVSIDNVQPAYIHRG